MPNPNRQKTAAYAYYFIVEHGDRYRFYTTKAPYKRVLKKIPSIFTHMEQELVDFALVYAF
jgi:hypothetical protein